MIKSYNAQLTDDRDRVRFLIGDTADPGDEDDLLLENEEIDWLLTEEPNIYYAAAAALGRIVSNSSGGVDETKLASLTLKWGGTAESAVRMEIRDLRERGAEKLRKLQFEVL